MKTVTYAQIVTLAAQRADRMDDTTQTGQKLTPSEATAVLGVINDELIEIWNAEAWPELCDHLESVTLTDWMFSKREGDADEMGEILAITEGQSPLVSATVTSLAKEQWTELNGRVNVTTTLGSVWVDWQTPCPDLLAVAAADLDAYELPARFGSALAYLAAAALLEAEDAARAERCRNSASTDLRNQASRLKRAWWRK